MIAFLGLLLTILFLFPSKALAVTVTISNIPAEISDQPFKIDVSVVGAQAGTNYLRANLFPSDTTKYFGYTYNGTSFVNGSDYSQYFPITIDSSSGWTGTIQAKLDSDSSYFNGSGTYSLKVRRYTQSGSSYTWSNEISLNVIFATPTPSPTPSPTATATPSPSSSPVSTSKTKSTASKSSSPSLTPSAHTTPSPSPQSRIITTTGTKSLSKTNYQVASVAATTASASPASVEVKSQKKVNPLPWIGGILLILGIGSLIFIYLRTKKIT